MTTLKNTIAVSAIAVLISFSAVVHTSCNKKSSSADTGPCVGVTCNNGNCIEGKCYCIAGFEGDKCDKSSRTRYLGQWAVQEKISGSSKPGNINKTNSYTLRIKTQPGSNIGLLLDNFTGNAAYNNILAYVGKKLNEAQLQYENDVTTNFAFEHTQKIEGTNITVIIGNGSITSFADEITAVYVLEYVEAGIPVRDTISLKAMYVQ